MYSYGSFTFFMKICPIYVNIHTFLAKFYVTVKEKIKNNFSLQAFEFIIKVRL